MGAGVLETFRPELNRTFKPEIIVLPTPEQVDRFAAKTFINQVVNKPNSVLTLPTGGTQLAWYKLARETYAQLGLDFSGLTVRNLDEYWPLPKSSPFNYRSYMNQNLFAYVNIPPERCHIPNSEADDPYAEAARYEAIVSSQPSDLAILGIGPGTTCHMGFNEKGTNFDSRTHYGFLDEQTRQVNAGFFTGELPPEGAITQGIGNILESEKIMLIAKGESKAWGIQRSLEGPIGADAPASFLRLHPHATFLLDSGAAGLLKTAR